MVQAMIFEFIPYKRYSYIIVCSNCNVFQAMIFPPKFFGMHFIVFSRNAH
jgi:hypothetical protein